MSRRALHFVFKIGDRTKTASFFRNVLGMKFLRHEEFEEGCKASCNGPYDGKWSKSMVGYGSEDNHFVIELTYNYGLGSYAMGDDFRGITVHSKQAVANAKKSGWPSNVDDSGNIVVAVEGYKFILVDKDAGEDPVQSVSLASSNLQRSVGFWKGLLGMKLYLQDEKRALMGFADNQCKLELYDIGKVVDHAKAYGRIAFSCPASGLPEIEKKMKDASQTILTPLVSLDTPGKATVQVVILADPDGHEICFVGDEAFRELSKQDPNADSLLDEGIAADKSNEWFAKKGLSKGTAQ